MGDLFEEIMILLPQFIILGAIVAAVVLVLRTSGKSSVNSRFEESLQLARRNTQLGEEVLAIHRENNALLKQILSELSQQAPK